MPSRCGRSGLNPTLQTDDLVTVRLVFIIFIRGVRPPDTPFFCHLFKVKLVFIIFIREAPPPHPRFFCHLVKVRLVFIYFHSEDSHSMAPMNLL